LLVDIALVVAVAAGENDGGDDRDGDGIVLPTKQPLRLLVKAAAAAAADML